MDQADQPAGEALIGEPELVPRAGAKAAIWRYFGFEPDEHNEPKDTDTAVCRLRTCKAKLKVKGGNTSNMIRHMKSAHPVYYAQLKVPTTAPRKEPQEGPGPSTSGTAAKGQLQLSSYTPYDRNSSKWKRLTEAVTYCIAKDVVPIYSVDKEGFRSMLRAFDPRYELPGRNYFANTALPKLYNKLREEVQGELIKTLKFSLTMDMWSSRTTEPYLGITIHYITEDWELRCKALQAAFMPEDHTADNIADSLRSTLADWNLSLNNMTCLTTDNGTNLIKMARDLNLVRLSCFGHNLHLAITNAMKDARVERTMGMCRNIVAAFSTSWKRRRELKEKQVSGDLPQRMLISECSTRWGSRQAMVARILEQEQAISRTFASDGRLRHLIPKWQDTMVMKDVNGVLEPLAQFTDMLSGDQYVSISSIVPTLALFRTEDFLGRRQADEGEEDPESELSVTMKDSIMAYLDGKYEDPLTRKLIHKCTLLDPRYKMDFVAGDDLAAVKRDLLEEALALTAQPEEARAEAAEVAEPPPKKAKLSSLFAKVRNPASHASAPTAPQTTEDRIKNELNHYLIQPVADEDQEPLSWWKSAQTQFPHISQLARRYLAICASSSPCERLFSKAGGIVSSKRASLKPENVNMLTFLSANL